MLAPPGAFQLPVSESRRRTSASERPSISTVFLAEVCPATIRTGTPSALERILSTALFALPRSAGALTRIFSASPSHPAIPSREEEGTALMGSVVLGGVSFMALSAVDSTDGGNSASG